MKEQNGQELKRGTNRMPKANVRRSLMARLFLAATAGWLGGNRPAAGAGVLKKDRGISPAVFGNWCAANAGREWRRKRKVKGGRA